MNNVLEKLDLTDLNLGASTGPDTWIRDPNGERLVSVNPTTGEPIAAVLQATENSYDRVVSQAREAFDAWRQIPAPRRGLLIRDFGDALREYQQPLAELVTLESGKILAESIGEVQEMIDVSDFAVGLSRQLYGLTMASERPGHRMYEQWHPLGPIGIITAFNFPVSVWSWNATVAATCGDTMIWKPSSSTPLAAIAVQHIANRVMADHSVSGVFNLAIGPGRTVGERMLNDARLPLISFTGSVKVGRHVAEAVARRLGRTILELGGNNAIIVTEDADLDLVVRAVLFAAIGTAGQRCTTTRRLIVHRSVSEELVQRLVRAYEQVPIGDPMQKRILMGPLIQEGAVEQMLAALKRATADGGEVLTGGHRIRELGRNFVEPAIVQMPEQTPVVLEETFAPILYVLVYDTLGDAIALQNGVPQGLSSALFTASLSSSEQFLSGAGSDCGIANVNVGTSGAEIGGAFGGEKETGGGRESGSDAWKGYMRRQTVTVNWSGKLPLSQGIEFA
jgi:aldehyde dehydrogenase (NAD+)